MPAVAGSVLVLALVAAPAFGHVGTTPAEVPAGETSSIAFRIGHGCDGSPTVRLAMEIPAGVTGVSPKAKEGWTIDVEEGTLPEPVEVDGEAVTEGAVAVTWSGGALDAHQWDEFEIRARMPDAAGETIFFPMIQTCDQGEYAWIQIPEGGAEEPETPAPGVVLVAATGGDHDHDEAEESESEAAAEEPGDDGSDSIAWLALAVGGLGVVVGGAALAMSARRRG